MIKIDSSEINLSEEKENYIEISSLREDNHPNLKKIKNINFIENKSISDDKNEFKTINSNNTGYPFLVFENCIFKDFEISNYKYELKFIGCTFENITLQLRFDNIVFEDCTVKNKFTIKNYLSLKDQKLSAGNNVVTFFRGSIHELLLYGLINFEHRLYINPQSKKNDKNCQIDKLSIEACSFLDKFKLQNTIVKEVEILDVNFEKNADFYKTQFQKGLNTNEIYFNGVVFSGMALFRDTKFFEKIIFEYAIFEKPFNFVKSIFFKGLDLENIISKEEINFYGIEILDKTTTSQETYRIIKNQFEKLNNKIEANKYHALELEQRKTELEKNKWQDFSEYLVFQIHDLSSKHSTSWFRAVLWIIFIGFFTIFLIHFNIIKDLFFHPSTFKIEYLLKIWSEFWQYINITNLEKLKDKPFIFFINKLSLGYLYYQFLTAVRKDTRK